MEAACSECYKQQFMQGAGLHALSPMPLHVLAASGQWVTVPSQIAKLRQEKGSSWNRRMCLQGKARKHLTDGSTGLTTLVRMLAALVRTCPHRKLWGLCSVMTEEIA